MDWAQIWLGMALALIGALLSYAVSVLISSWWYKKKTKLMGEWKSKYMSPYGNHDWVVEDINITTSRGKICLESNKNPVGDHYVAYVKLVANEYLTGLWESTINSAHAKGALMLTIHPLGHSMYGYFVGRDDDNRCFHGAWALTKKGNQELERLAECLRLLEKSSQTFIREHSLSGQCLGTSDSLLSR